MTRISRRRFVGNTATAAGAGLLAPLAGRLAAPVAAAPRIPRRPFGETGVEVTIVGLGGGSRFYTPVPDDEEGADLVRQTVERGIEYIETGANYGPQDVSERRIGLAMKTHRARVFLETKIDARDYEGAMREMERSFKLLQTDHIDLMLHHFLKPGEIDKVLAENGAEKAIRKMVDQKAVRFRGFSTHVPQVALDGIGRLEPQAMQLIVNATRIPDFEPEVLPLAKTKSIAVVVMKSIGKGYFLRHNFTTPDRMDKFGPPAGVLDKGNLPVAREYLHYALSQPVSTVVVGVDCVQTLGALVKDASEFKPLTVAQLKSISERAQVFRSTGYWIPQSARLG
jgi:aryl-alcohol dehydrogenase-like predicted oxidoreductase